MKGVHVALKVAQETNTPIDIIGGTFIDASEKEFLEASRRNVKIAMVCATLHLDLSHDKKVELLQHAKACLIPSAFKEPFGLTCVECLATGTPVIVWNDGALPEIVNSPKVGAVCPDYDSFFKAVQGIDSAEYGSVACRERAQYFSRETMATNYVKLYEEAIAKGW